MVEIKHKQTGEVLATIDADSLVGADLRDMRLNGADLRGADLSDANLEFSDLVAADLGDAVLRGALLMSAHLNDAELAGADLSRVRAGSDRPAMAVVLSGANLSRAILQGADLRNAEIRGATDPFPTARFRIGIDDQQALCEEAPSRRKPVKDA